MNLFKNYFKYLYKQAYELNEQNIISALKLFTSHPKILDIGCWDGVQTKVWQRAAQTKFVYGLESIRSAALEAQKNGINVQVYKADKKGWPYKDNSFDCLISNQVIEHLSSVDNFLSECYRLLKPNGILITSTNNLASWHNIFSLFFGWTPFDLTNSSSLRLGIGNPLAINRNNSDVRGASWTHKTIYTAHWLAEWQSLYKLKQIAVFGAGFYPLTAKIGQIFPNHAAFITIVSQKIE